MPSVRRTRRGPLPTPARAALVGAVGALVASLSLVNSADGAGGGESTKALLAEISDATASVNGPLPATDAGGAWDRAEARANDGCRAAKELVRRDERSVTAPLIGWVNAAAAAPLRTLPMGFLADPVLILGRCAATQLGRLRDPQAIEPLLASLPSLCDPTRAMSDDPFVPRSVFKGLAEIHDPRAVPPVLAFVASTCYGAYGDTDPDVVLARFGRPAVPALTAGLADRSTAGMAAEALGHIGGADAVGALATALAAERETAGAAARALVEIGGSEAKQALLARLESGQASPEVAAALYPFYKRHLGDLLPYLQSPQTVKVYAALLAGLKSGDIPRAELETQLIDALNRFGDTEMANAFLDSGVEPLDVAARAWAAANGYCVTVVAAPC